MKTILIVEDEVNLREVYSEVLRDAGYNVIETGDGEAAKGMIAGSWDLLLLDIMLPRLDGIEILKGLHSAGIAKQRIVLIISNLDNEAIIKECYANGARGYIIKANVTPREILDTVVSYFPND